MNKVTLAELRKVLTAAAPKRRIDEIVLHHTWAPTAAQYKGAATWEAIRRYHVDNRGWSDIGYHVGIGPDGSIWTLRPAERSGAHVLNRNAHTLGVAIVGNFDSEDPMRNGLPVAADVCRMALEVYKLPVGAVRFHREFQPKSCPGKLVGLAEFRTRVAGAAPEQKPSPITVTVDGHPTAIGVWIADGITYGPLASLARALGADTAWDPQTRTVAITTRE
jgi:hypothetical protein